MNFLSAEEDFGLRTLASIEGVLARLAYITQLRAAGGYAHWGMEKTYGRDAARDAIAANHSRLFAEVVSAQLRELTLEVAKEGAVCADGGAEPLSFLRANRQGAVPADRAGAAPTHLSFVLESLSLLEQSSRASNRQAA